MYADSSRMYTDGSRVFTDDSRTYVDNGSDTAHSVSINKIPSHQYNMTVKSTKTLQFQCISHEY
jgi:hypothetical protein